MNKNLLGLSMTTLCVVDMQSEFESAARKCLDAVLREIKLAMRRKAGIVILEYRACGETLPEIMELLKGYEHYIVMEKTDDDGGHELILAACMANIPLQRVRFSGVNRTACVTDTIDEFSYLMAITGRKHEVEVAINATWDEKSPAYGRRMLRKRGKFVNCKRKY